MIKDQEILGEIKNLRKKTQLLANPLYNDSGGSKLYSEIDSKLKSIEESLIKDKQIYNW